MAITNKEVLSVFKEGTQIYDIANAIRSEASQGYQDYVPLANKDNVAQLQNAFRTNQQLMNEWVHGIINKVSKTILTTLIVREVFEEFKRGSADLGDTVEEIHVNLAKEHLYDSKKGEAEVFKTEDPDVSAFYHKINRKVFYKQSIADSEIIRAFNSWNGVTNLVTKIINSMYNGNRNDEYKYMKLIIESAFAGGAFHIVPVGDISTAEGMKKMVEKAREYSLLCRDVNHYNPAGVENTTQADSQYVILPAKTQAKLDVNVLASAFNMSNSDFLGKKIDINYFGNEEIVGALIDRNFYVVFDQIFEVRNIYNPENMKWTYWLHVHQFLSYSPFHTAIAFVSGTPDDITAITLTPPVSVLGKSPVTLQTHVKTPDDVLVPDGLVFEYTTNSTDSVTLTPTADGKGVTVELKDTAVPGDLLTVVATTTHGPVGEEKEYKATAQIQISTEPSMLD